MTKMLQQTWNDHQFTNKAAAWKVENSTSKSIWNYDGSSELKSELWRQELCRSVRASEGERRVLKGERRGREGSRRSWKKSCSGLQGTGLQGRRDGGSGRLVILIMGQPNTPNGLPCWSTDRSSARLIAPYRQLIGRYGRSGELIESSPKYRSGRLITISRTIWKQFLQWLSEKSQWHEKSLCESAKIVVSLLYLIQKNPQKHTLWNLTIWLMNEEQKINYTRVYQHLGK